MAPLGRGAAAGVAHEKSRQNRRVSSTAGTEEVKRIALAAETEAQVSEAAKWMRDHDQDKNGSLDRRELTSLMSALAREVVADSEHGIDLVAGTTAQQPPVMMTSEGVDKFITSILKEEGRRLAAQPGQSTTDGPTSGDTAPPAAASAALSITAEHVPVYTQRFRAWIKRCMAIEKMFQDADANKDGSLAARELLVFLQKAAPKDYTVTDADCKYILEACDLDGSGAIEVDELGPVIAAWMELIKAVKLSVQTSPPKQSSACLLL